MPPIDDQSSRYRMPAEWENQHTLWFSWPSASHLWEGRMNKVQDELLRTISDITQSDHVGINGAGLKSAGFQKRLEDFPELKRERLILSEIPNDDAWCRDHGPTFVEDKETGGWAGIDWNFDAWGGKYQPVEDDHRVASRLLDYLETPKIECPFIGEGGGIEVNGQGSVMLTKSVWLNPNRNIRCKKGEIETWLLEHLGCEQIHWFTDGLIDDDTDGHVDMFARYVSESAIIVCHEKRPRHPQYRAVQQIREELEGFRTLSGGHYDVIDLPMPEPVFDSSGNRCPASYANFLIFNDYVWVPQYNQEKADNYAMGVLQECFSNHEIRGINCTDLITEGGAIHCLTQQQPKIVPTTKDQPIDPLAYLMI